MQLTDSSALLAINIIAFPRINCWYDLKMFSEFIRSLYKYTTGYNFRIICKNHVICFKSQNRKFKVCLVGELMVEIISKFSRFSESFLAIILVPTNHHGAHAVEYLPFVCSQKPSQSCLQIFVIINPHNRF